MGFTAGDSAAAALEALRGRWREHGSAATKPLDAFDLLVSERLGPHHALAAELATHTAAIRASAVAAWGKVDRAVHREILRQLKPHRARGRGVPDPMVARARALKPTVRAHLADHPLAASVVIKLLDDTKHHLGLTAAIHDPATRDETLSTLRELAAGKTLAGRRLADVLAQFPGAGPLFAPLAADVNHHHDGRRRELVHVEAAQRINPALAVGAQPEVNQVELVSEHAHWLETRVLPMVRDEMGLVIDGIPGLTFSARAKPTDAILEKVRRSVHGSRKGAGRADFTVGHVLDAAGARVVAADVSGLAATLSGVLTRFGTGDAGRILEVESLYAHPRPYNPAYRNVSITAVVSVDGAGQAFELQLQTRRASLASDLEHNVIYKPYVELTEAELAAVVGMLEEAAALDQVESRRIRW